MSLASCVRSPRLKKLVVFLVGTGLGIVLYLLMLQANDTYRDTAMKSVIVHVTEIPVTEAKKQEPAAPLIVYPKWWPDAWHRSAVSGQLSKFVGDKPLFPPCLTTPSKWPTYPFLEKQKFVKGCKNPCWLEDRKGVKVLNCVPYFYLAGVGRAATTDLAKRIRMHPDIFHGTDKEYHWWDRSRFGPFSEDNPPKTVDMAGGKSFKEYTDQITGRGVLDLQAELRKNSSSSRIFGDYSPSYFWDPKNWYVLEGNQGCTEPRYIVAQHMRHVFPGARILLMFRHPTTRLYSDFISRTVHTPELKGSTAEDFLLLVTQSIQMYKKCFRAWSVRHCAYNMTLFKETPVRLVEGMYPVFMADWLRVWSKKQLHIMRYEDYGGHERERLAEIFKFLGLSPLDPLHMDKLMGFHPVNTGTAGYKKIGPMTEKTEKILNDFYRPFMNQLADMLQDERFLWRDINA